MRLEKSWLGCQGEADSAHDGLKERLTLWVEQHLILSPAGGGRRLGREQQGTSSKKNPVSFKHDEFGSRELLSGSRPDHLGRNHFRRTIIITSRLPLLATTTSIKSSSIVSLLRALPQATNDHSYQHPIIHSST